MQAVMMMIRQWHDVDVPNIFITYRDDWHPILEALGMDINVAWLMFSRDYDNAYTIYDDYMIYSIWQEVYQANYLKYQKFIAAASAEYEPIENYNMIEVGQDIRTPNLTNQMTLNTTAAMTDTRSTQVYSHAENTSQINQTRTNTDTPSNYTTTSTHKVNPYDNPGFVNAEEDVSVQTGSRTNTETYSGNPDTSTTSGNSSTTNTGGTSTTNTGTNTSTETGTEKNDHKLTRRGNIGVTTSQQMLESELALAEKMNLFRIIEQDIASKLFLQVW